MLRNYLTIALRRLRRRPGYAAINIAGLAVGIACCLIIALFVADELSYDRFHENADRIFRIHVGERQTVTPNVAGPILRRTFPEVEETARVYQIGSFSPAVVRYGDIVHQEGGYVLADSTIFSVLTLPLIAGNPKTALTRPRTVVLTASTARKYFRNESPVGTSLSIDGADFEVTGVVRDIPANSHLQFDIMGSFATSRWSREETWGSANFWTYILLRDRGSIASLEAKIPALIREEQAAGRLGNEYALTFQPITGIYLDFEGRRVYVYLFSVIAMLVLLIACINYMNLATAHAVRRAREVGMRKAVGAGRGQLARQFFGESALMAFAAMLLAMLLVELMLPVFNQISGKSMTISYLEQPLILFGFVTVAAVTAIVAGSYPALMLSSFRPASVLKGTFRAGKGGAALRKGLVIFQFAASVFLIVATTVVFSQLGHVQTQNLGFDREHVVILPIGDPDLRQNYEPLKQELLRDANVLSVSAVNSFPGYQRGGYAFEAEGLVIPEGEFMPILGMQADRDVVKTLGLDLIAGPGFPRSEAYTLEQGYRYIINETAARRAGWTPDEAVGKWFNVLGNRRGDVVGVVRDFHHWSLHAEIQPLALFIEPGTYEYLLVRLGSGDVTAALAGMRETWQRMASHRPFEYRFLDQEYDALYAAERRLAQVFTIFAGLAILIACLGLFGLAVYTAEQRTREVGIRKVMGATVPSVVALLSKDFARLVLIATVIAAPVGYYVMSRWLEDFAYRIEISWWIFALAGGIALVIALLTVSSQAVKAAVRNPVEALRYE